MNQAIELPFLGTLLPPAIAIDVANGLVDPVTKVKKKKMQFVFDFVDLSKIHSHYDNNNNHEFFFFIGNVFVSPIRFRFET